MLTEREFRRRLQADSDDEAEGGLYARFQNYCGGKDNLHIDHLVVLKGRNC
jgi:hypothetical protein